MDEIMLKIDNLSKKYKLGQIGGTTLRDELQRMRAKRRGEEDPTKRIGAKEYKSGETFMALDGVSFEVKKGERVGIIGHNGAGKSTLLKLISRVTAPTGGLIGLNGRVASMLEVGTGFHGELTGRENIYMNGAILGMTKKEIDAKMEDIIEFSEVRQFIDTPVKRYSSGMYVKLAFSVAAHLDSEIMIMDEVLAVGDMAFQKKCLEKMSDVSNVEGRTVLYVSHNMDTIRRLCDRCIVLDKGKVVFDGEVGQAIEIYMGSNELGYGRVFEIEEASRHKGITGKIRIERIEILNEIPLSLREKLRVKLYWSVVDTELQHITFRLLVGNNKNGLIGMGMTKQLIVQNINFGTIELDTSMLAPGKYYVNIEAFNHDTGNQIFHDSIKGFQFEVLDNTMETNGFTWYRPWGDISFPQIKCWKDENNGN